MAAFFDATSDHLPRLPLLEELTNQPVNPKDKASVALHILRKTAQANRRSTIRPFYSIRTVARHFELPATTVTRMYTQLKAEGVLGGIWGSKTIIEPAELDNGIRLRGVVLLPVPLRAFSATSTYRIFVRAMQLNLWKERFASHVLFYDDAPFNGAEVAEVLSTVRADGVVWLMPERHASKCFPRLADRGVKCLVITDEVPINGEPGYYLRWRDAVTEALSSWKRLGTNRVTVVNDLTSVSSGSLRTLQSCLTMLGFSFQISEGTTVSMCERIGDTTAPESGVIFLTPRVLAEFSQTGLNRLENLLRTNRVLSIHGGADWPFQTKLNDLLDFVNFDWEAIARRLVNDVVARGCLDHVKRQIVFKGTWNARTRRPLSSELEPCSLNGSCCSVRV